MKILDRVDYDLNCIRSEAVRGHNYTAVNNDCLSALHSINNIGLGEYHQIFSDRLDRYCKETGVGYESALLSVMNAKPLESSSLVNWAPPDTGGWGPLPPTKPWGQY